MVDHTSSSRSMGILRETRSNSFFEFMCERSRVPSNLVPFLVASPATLVVHPRYSALTRSLVFPLFLFASTFSTQCMCVLSVYASFRPLSQCFPHSEFFWLGGNLSYHIILSESHCFRLSESEWIHSLSSYYTGTVDYLITHTNGTAKS